MAPTTPTSASRPRTAPVYSDSGKEFFNLKDTEKAKALLEEAGYNGEELVLLTNKDYTTMYNAALVMQAQLQAIGMNVRLEVQDWPATIATRDNQHDAWNYHFTGWGTNMLARLPRGLQVPGEAQADLQLRQPRGHRSPSSTRPITTCSTCRPSRSAPRPSPAPSRRVMEHGMALPFGWLTKNQATRANVHNFVPFRIPRMYNVWIERPPDPAGGAPGLAGAVPHDRGRGLGGGAEWAPTSCAGW